MNEDSLEINIFILWEGPPPLNPTDGFIGVRPTTDIVEVAALIQREMTRLADS